MLPDVDGARIDDIVDYITFVFLPLLLLEAVGRPATRLAALPVIAIVLLSSMYGFAPDAETHRITSSPAFRLAGTSSSCI